MSDAFVFGVDLDGVCADFYGRLRPIAAEWMGVDVDTLTEAPSWGLLDWGLDKEPESAVGYNALHRFAVTQRDLFGSLEPMRGAAQALRRLSDAGVRIRIITHRLFIHYTHHATVAQTVQWLDNHDFPYWDLCFMKDKAAVGADLYIDDSPSNILALQAVPVPVIAFTNSTNLKTPATLRAKDWIEVERITLERVKEWQTKGNAAKPVPGH